MSKQKKTGTNLSIQTTLQLLADVDKKQGTRKEIVEKYGIPHNTLSTIVKNRVKLERPCLVAEFQPDRARQRTTEKLDIDQALFLWFKQGQSNESFHHDSCAHQIKGSITSNRTFYKPSVFATLYE